MAFVSTREPLAGDLDIESKVAEIPAALQVKGIFFSRLRERVGAGFVPHYGSWEYLLGQMEGLVMHFGDAPQTEVSPAGSGVRLDIRLG